MKFQIRFYEDWHSGSGMSGGAEIDLEVVRDGNGLPCFPGKAIKGLFRDAAETIKDLAETESSKEEWSSFIARAFGMSGSAHGCLNFGNAKIPAGTRQAILQKTELIPGLYRTIQATAIDEEGQAKNKSLRRLEFVIPLDLEFCIVCPVGLPEKDMKKLLLCPRWIKRMGLARTRGYGRCDVLPVQGATV